MKELYEIIGNSTIDGYIVRLPNIELPRKTYIEIKKAMNFIDGEWIGGNIQGFLFDYNPEERLKSILNKEYTIDTKKESQFFETPKELAKNMAELLNPSSHDRILEPSAGRGSLIKAVLDTDRENLCESQFYVYENLKMNKDILLEKYPRVNFIGDDFEKNKTGTYNKIIANPPFSKNKDIKHFFKMMSHLSRFGTLVCLISNHYQKSTDKESNMFNYFVNSTDFNYWYDIDLKEIPSGTFKESGTNISTTLVRIQNINEYGSEFKNVLENILEEYKERNESPPSELNFIFSII